MYDRIKNELKDGSIDPSLDMLSILPDKLFERFNSKLVAEIKL